MCTILANNKRKKAFILLNRDIKNILALSYFILWLSDMNQRTKWTFFDEKTLTLKILSYSHFKEGGLYAIFGIKSCISYKCDKEADDHDFSLSPAFNLYSTVA